ncbi:molybdenum cofactor biosynthesis protein MoaE [Sphingomonas sp.]|uniref:molybdenum cofactor biosynthesis protein MoaE n=1 Tax=Sphingomonas sp. TaxID=28214 RepID=UPI00286D1482|nr:molybdenum cofactor biosynthesis protein MoaE [Sphingomonas sp.]
MIAAAPIDPVALLAAFTAGVAGAGAIASFTGLVRSDDGDVSELWLDHHPVMTDQVIAEIAAEARSRFEAIVHITHRVGSVAAGEPIVFVAAAARHRRAAFDAVEYMMDRLKTDAPLWKREARGDTAVWIEARDVDHRDRARWEEPQ